MEESNVIIKLQTLQRRPEGDELLREEAVGTLCREGEGWLLRYREGENSGLGKTLTTLRLEGGRVTLCREGEVNARMVFQAGESHSCRYATPYGELPITVRTLRLEWEMNGMGGKAFLIYKIQVGGADVGENRLRLTVKTKENSYDR